MKVGKPAREIKLHKKNPKHKTVYLDLDETLIHCDENSSNYTVRLNFPVDGGGNIAVGLVLGRQACGCVPTARILSVSWPAWRR